MRAKLSSVQRAIKSGSYWPVAGLLLFSTAAGFGGGWAASHSNNQNLLSGGNTQVSQRIVSSESQLIADVAEQVTPSVVSITVESAGRTAFGQSATQQSAGTGMIVSEDGLVLTNKHVIPAGAAKITVITSDETKYTDISVVGRDPLNDIAYIRIKDGKNLKAAKLGDSDALRVGDKVVAIGNALGEFSNTVTSGIISAKGRPLVAGEAGESEKLQNLIQTDAAINSGNSGGPLVNMNGEVVGMNTAKADAQSIGFSIPINDIRPGLKTVLDSGKLSRPYLGIRYISLTPAVAKELNISDTKGAYVNGTSSEPAIIPDGPADKAGVKEGDIIIKLDGTEVDDKNQLTTLLSGKKVGDSVKLTIKRDGKEQQISVKLEAAPEL